MAVVSWLADSCYYGELPAGCRHCAEGAKLVVLVTGLCNTRCYYCPLSEKKRHKDVTYANELLVKSRSDLISEAKTISAEGSGLTGGDPMAKPRRTVDYIKYLKEHFGNKHHIHMYTVPDFEPTWLGKLAKAGLDEIRFHIPLSAWKRKSGEHLDLISTALGIEPHMDVGVELPALPGQFDILAGLAERLDGLGVQFLNLNELEFSETNWQALRKKGFDVKNDISAGVEGSEELGIKLVEYADSSSFDMGVHYCSSSFKDAIQLRNRIMRRAEHTKKSYDIVTEEGMFIRGVIETSAPQKLISELRARYKIPKKLIEYDRAKSRVELAAWILEDIAADLEDCECYIVEEFPTADRLEVERRKI
ncbi:MAG: radical SAM protein [Thermoplasmata archaeon]|nr:MAG: radical SAM protein [Thermoplasmata archaeon]